MDFVGYAERAAELANAPFESIEDVRAHLGGRSWLVEQVTDRDVRTLVRFGRRVHAVFEHGDAGRVTDAVGVLNTLLASYRITPLVVAADDPGTDRLRGDGAETGRWRFHVADRAASVADLLVAEALMGLATLTCDRGPDRLGLCSAHDCDNAYVDLSPNRSRRYCSDRCATRANVAAYRARRRSAKRQADTAGTPA